MTLLLIDTETGGTDENIYSLLSTTFTTYRFGTTRVHKSQELNLLVRPDDGTYVIHPRALEVNNINLIEHYKNAISYTDANREIVKFLKKINEGEKSKPLLCGQNISFDMKFLYYNLIEENTMRKYVNLRAIEVMTLGSFAILKGLIPENQSLKLADIATFLKIPLDESRLHTADYDNEVTAKVLFAYTKMFESAGVKYAR